MGWWSAYFPTPSPRPRRSSPSRVGRGCPRSVWWCAAPPQASVAHRAPAGGARAGQRFGLRRREPEALGGASGEDGCASAQQMGAVGSDFTGEPLCLCAQGTARRGDSRPPPAPLLRAPRCAVGLPVVHGSEGLVLAMGDIS